MAGRETGHQVIRSAAGVGANLKEAQTVMIQTGYTHKVSISLREARETLYRMRRIERNDLWAAKRLLPLKGAWGEIADILTVTQKAERTSGMTPSVSLLTSHFSLPHIGAKP